MSNPAAAPSLFKKNLAAIGLCLVAWTAFTGTDTLCKLLTQDYSVPQVIFLTNFVGLVLSLSWVLKAYGLKAFKTRFLKWHLARGASVTCTSFLVVNSFSRIPLADFYGIVFLSPLVLLLMAHFLLHERIGIHRVMATVAGFIGVLILAGPQFQTHNAGLLFALGAVFFVATNGLIIRKMKEETILPLFALFPSLFNTVVNFPMMLGDFRMPEAADIPLFLVVAPLLLVGLVGFSAGFARATETAVVTPFGYIQMILGVIIGFFLFGDVPTLPTIIGSSVIIASGLYTIWREHRAHSRANAL